MSQISKYVCEELSGAEISCLMVKAEPWCRGIEIAKVLGYKYESDAVKDHVPLKFKNTLSFLVRTSNLGKNQFWTVGDLNTAWIS